jgi:hypothetical protein
MSAAISGFRAPRYLLDTWQSRVETANRDGLNRLKNYFLPTATQET